METFKITTDETLRETIQHGNNRYPFAYYPDNIWKFDFHRIDWHWHHELEFLYIAEGTALCLIGTFNFISLEEIRFLPLQIFQTSSGYFCRKFRQYYHMSPNEYRKRRKQRINPHPFLSRDQCVRNNCKLMVLTFHDIIINT